MIRQRVATSLSGRRRRTSSGNPPLPPPQYAAGQQSSDESQSSAVSQGSSSDEGGGTAAGKPWMRVDRSVYEEQLEKLQEQLVQVMIENQTLQGARQPSGNFRTELQSGH